MGNTMPGQNQRLARGDVLLGYQKFIKKKWGADGLEACIKETGHDFSMYKNDKWYPNDWCDDILKWMAKTHGIDYCRQLGKDLTENVGMIEFAAKIMGIERVLDRGGDQFKRSFDFGQIDIERTNKEARVIFTDVSICEEACMAWKGGLEGIMKITGAKGTVEEVECQLKGSSKCVYIMKWQ